MNSYAEVVVLVEGKTEKEFINSVLAPFFWNQNIHLIPTILNKPGQKGGDVKFARAQKDIRAHLLQRPDTYLTLMVDYYGIDSRWPGYEEAKQVQHHADKASVMNRAIIQELKKTLENIDLDKRFIPYISMHELEALWFSDPAVLAETLGISQSSVDVILNKYKEPEAINDRPNTSPSKQLQTLYSRYRKIEMGISIATRVGIEKISSECPIFANWLEQIASLQR